MKALLIFGQRFGQDNPALIELGNRIKELGVEVSYAQHDDKIIGLSNIDIIVGHSFGGYRAIDLVSQTTGTVRYLALIDYCDMRWFPLGFKYYWPKFEVPNCVLKADAFTRAFNLLPPAGKISNTNANFINHEGINVSHAEIPRHPEVVKTLLKSIGELN